MYAIESKVKKMQIHTLLSSLSFKSFNTRLVLGLAITSVLKIMMETIRFCPYWQFFLKTWDNVGCELSIFRLTSAGKDIKIRKQDYLCSQIYIYQDILNIKQMHYILKNTFVHLNSFLFQIFFNIYETKSIFQKMAAPMNFVFFVIFENLHCKLTLRL